MTADQQHSDRGAGRPARRPGIDRRTTLALAWASPVIAAAVAAPGAAASLARPGPGSTTGATPPGVPTVSSRTLVGVQVDEVRGVPGGFVTDVTLVGFGPSGVRVMLEEEVQIDIATEHDVAEWGTGIVVTGPRSGYIVVPPGSYLDGNTGVLDGALVEVSPWNRYLTKLAPTPSGAYRVTATVRRHAYQGRNAPGFAAPTSSTVVHV
ncbi:hypothetical protein GSU69_07430 [Rathayibacter festucae]|uniref:Uncharacterized protein n=1 Tax=Rathayibacter festucae TaxID=110937 RepID=A0ABX6GYD9_9MICO|nr:hypothetical protein [Rathayibacter festucae]QHC62521.1 hypothetical protein GSU69_07430 [Rathayibacter festucae]